MFLNIIMYIWIISYMFAGLIIINQMYKGIYMTYRELGFFVFGLLFSGVPFYWLIHNI